MATQKTRRPSLYGLTQPLTGLQQEPIVANRAPLTTDSAELGTIWVDTNANDFSVLTNVSGTTNTWTGTTGGATTLTSLTVNPGNVVVTAGTLTVGSDVTATGGTTTVGTFVAGNSQINGTLDVTGATTLTDLTATGNVVINGDFDLVDTASISLTSTNNAAGALTFLANGGALETIVIQSAQGTGDGAIFIDSVAGGVDISGAKASANAINMHTTNAAGGMTIATGTNGLTVNSTNGAIALNSGTAAINVGTDGVQHTITLGNSTGNTSVVINNGTGALNLGTNAIAHAITMGNNTGATSVSIQAGTAGAGAINIGTTANAVPVTIGNVTGATSVAINSGTGGVAVASTGAGDITLASSDTLLLDSAGVLELNSSAAAISIGNDAVAQAINIGTGAAARTITRGNVTTTTAIVDNTGTGGYQLNTTGAGDVDINASHDFLVDAARAFSIDSVAASNVTVTGASIDLTLSSAGGSVMVTASEAAADAVTIQASNAAGGVVIDSFGTVAVTPSIATVASPTASSTQDFRVIRTIFTGFTTASAATQDFTITSNKILTTSGVFVSVANLNASTNGAQMGVLGVTQAAGSIIIHTKNNGAGSLGAGDNVVVSVWIIS